MAPQNETIFAAGISGSLLVKLPPRATSTSTDDRLRKSYIPRFAALTLVLWLCTDASRVPAEDRQASLGSFDRVVTQAMSVWHVPGLALVVVDRHGVVLAKGFGYRDLQHQRPVTTATLFPIGSASKSFTSLIFGILNDQGRVGWDDPVRQYFPGFQLSDPVATEHATARDLLSHRTGLPAHDLVWYSSSADRADFVRRLQYLQFSKDFRSTFQYSNLMVMTLGYAEGQVTHSTWEELVRSLVFQPLEMSSSVLSIQELQQRADFAQPYELKHGTVMPVPFKDAGAIGPAGGVNSNISDLSHYLIFQLGDGTYHGKRVVSQANLRLVHTGQTAIGPLPDSFEVEGLGPMVYAMGWVETTYRGHRMVWHNGDIDGFHSLMTLLPEDGLGVVILCNLGSTQALEPIAYSAFDRLLGLVPRPWIERYRSLGESTGRQAQAAAGHQSAAAQPAAPPSHALSELAGEYTNPGYGTVTITQAQGTLQLSLNQLPPVPFAHERYDIFQVPPDADGPLQGMRGQFYMDIDGNIDRVTIPLEPALADGIAFTRVRAQQKP